MKNSSLKLLAGFAALSLAALDLAETSSISGGTVKSARVKADDQKLSGLSLRVGVFLPTEKSTRDVAESMFSGGVDFRLADINRNISTFLSLDFADKSGFRNVPLLFNAKEKLGPIYVIGGAGISFTRRPTDNGTEDKTRFSYEGGVGFDFGGETPVFVEGRFIGSDIRQLNGVGVFLGVRF